jgi:hypothetical protein
MDQLNVMVFGNLLALNTEVEAMKIDNKYREINGLTDFNYKPDDFFKKAEEIRSATNELFK